MKYIVIAVGYIIIWCILLPSLILERTLKLLWIAIQIMWHLKIKNEWFRILEEYFFVIPVPIAYLMVMLMWKIANLKDYFLLKNWKNATKWQLAVTPKTMFGNFGIIYFINSFIDFAFYYQKRLFKKMDD